MKPRFCLALVLCSLGFLFSTARTHCQQTVSASPDSNTAGLPDAASATQRTTCSHNNGKPCAPWLHKLVGQYPAVPESGKVSEPGASSVHFWTYRGLQDPPLRTNKQVFRSKLFVATHIGGAIAMIVACRNKRSREEWHSEMPAVAALVGMDYIQFRFIGGPSAIAPPIYEMVHYGIASTR